VAHRGCQHVAHSCQRLPHICHVDFERAQTPITTTGHHTTTTSIISTVTSNSNILAVLY
jgi:hypothetical protein